MNRVQFATSQVILFLLILNICNSGCIDHQDEPVDLQTLIERVNPGETLVLSPGTYEGGVLINKQIHIIGTANKSIITRSRSSSNEDYVLSIQSDQCTLENITIQNELYHQRIYGIKIQASHTMISHTTMRILYCGISIGRDARFNVIDKNVINENRIGLILFNASKNTISENHITNCSESGISLISYSKNNSIIGNTINRNMYGIHLSDGTWNNVIENTLDQNVRGIYCCCNARFNTISQNALTRNSEYNARDVTQNYWSDQDVGNYYDDYQGTDINNDTIGDQPHPIPGGKNVDRYPLFKYSSIR